MMPAVTTAPPSILDPATLASSAVIAAFVTGLFLLFKSLVDRRVRPVASPADENETIRLGNEFLSGLLKDAREERKELRATISALEADGTTKRERIEALEALDRRKTAQIGALERRAEAAAAKLRAGLTLTLEDILGPDHRFLAELDAELEDTINNN